MLQQELLRQFDARTIAFVSGNSLMRCTFLIAMSLFAAQRGARADVVEVLWSSDGGFAHQSTVARGKFAEVCGKLPVSASVRWEFEASSPLDFNIHYHAGKDVVFPSKVSAVATANNIFRARVAQDYCWMWSNKSTEFVTLNVKLQRE